MMLSSILEGKRTGACGTTDICDRSAEMLQFSTETPANLRGGGEMRNCGGSGG